MNIPDSSNRDKLFTNRATNTGFTRFNWELTEQDRFLIDVPGGSVSEDMFKVFALAGYEVGHFYIDGETSGLNWQIQALLGTPLYSQVLNTNSEGESFNSGFDGYQYIINTKLGYRINKYFLFAGVLKVSYEQQNEIESENKTLENGVTVRRALPENSLKIIQPTLNLYWSF